MYHSFMYTDIFFIFIYLNMQNKYSDKCNILNYFMRQKKIANDN